MQDDFGDFLQASPAADTGKPAFSMPAAQRKDLSAKIKESFDLSGGSQKAALNFKPVARHAARRPQMGHSVPSSKSADWSHLDVKTSDFMAPVRPQTTVKQTQRPPRQTNYAHQLNAHNPNLIGNFPPGSQAAYVAAYQTMPTQPNLGFGPVASPPRFMTPVASGNISGVPAMMSNSVMSYGVFGAQAQGQSVCSQKPFQQGFNVHPRHMSPEFHPANVSQQILRHSASRQERSSDVALPSWMTNPSEIPALYKEVLKLCATPNSFADTSRLYPILVSSKLPKDVLGHIWSAANQSTPGQLTFSEVYIALALVAVAQRGDMSLTVKYVTSLNAPPIPNIQLGTVTGGRYVAGNVSTTAAIMGEPSTTIHSGLSQDGIEHVDGFTDYQSVPAPRSADKISPRTPKAIQQSMSVLVNKTDADFDDFQAFKPSSQQNSTDFVSSKTATASFAPLPLSNVYGVLQPPASEQSYPDRSLINSPKAHVWYNTSPPSSISPAALPGLSSVANPDDKLFYPSFDPRITKSGSTHSLPTSGSSVPNLNNLHAASSSSKLADPVDDDFGDFKMNVGVSQEDTFAKLNLPGLNPGFVNGRAPNPKPNLNLNYVQKPDLMSAEDVNYDKYSALRDLVPPAVGDSDATMVDNSFGEYSDFQSVPPPKQGASDLLDIDGESKNGWSASGPDLTPFPPKSDAWSAGHDSPVSFGMAAVIGVDRFTLPQEDSSSVNSLELPSLSKTISSFSIGITPTFPSQVIEPMGSSDSRKNESSVVASSADEGTGACSSGYSNGEMWHGEIKPDSSRVTSNTFASEDNQLYNLDEPISPPMARKELRNGNKPQPGGAGMSGTTKPMSPPTKRFVVPRNISDADSDFGDFSYALPPMDDMADHDAEFDMYQVGNSSLVDFDAFGHFEEAKQETRKKIVGKLKKEESTAFSEFVKSDGSVFDDPSNREQSIAKDQNVDERWSAFKSPGMEDNGTDVVQELPSEIQIQCGNSARRADRESCEQAVLGADEPNIPGLSRKVESLQGQNLSEENSAALSKWDKEGEELKARMEGNVVSNPTELYIEHWGRCLTTCKDIIASTGEIFAALNSPAVCLEIVNSTRGKEFISCTSEVYGVARRIRKGIEIIGLNDNDLSQTLKEIEIAWNNVLGFCPYTPSVHKTPEHCAKPVTEGSGQTMIVNNMSCSLCLLATVGDSPIGVEYGGRSYHAPCANLWLNQVAPILPRLELPPVS